MFLIPVICQMLSLFSACDKDTKKVCHNDVERNVVCYIFNVYSQCESILAVRSFLPANLRTIIGSSAS